MPFDWSQLNPFGGQKEFGAQDQIKKFYQNPLLSNMQQGAQYLYQAKALKDLLYPSGSSFEPIRNEALRQYRENTLPGVMNAVGQRPNSSAFGQTVGRSQEDLETRLAALRSDWQERQNERIAQNARQMMQYGMQPSFETVFAPVPTESARAYLKQQGLPETPENIQKYLPMFEPQQSLGQTVGQNIQNLPETIKNLPPQVQDYYNRLAQSVAQSRGGGAPSREELLANTPQVKEAVDKSLTNSTPIQQEASDWVIKNKKYHMPILTSDLQANDWPFLEAIMKSTDPQISNMAYQIENRDQLQQLSKILLIQDEKKRFEQVKAFINKLGAQSRRKSNA
jgi:hypothetical protein